MLSDVSPQLRGNLDLRTITVELLPLLLHVITPTLRPVRFLYSTLSCNLLGRGGGGGFDSSYEIFSSFLESIRDAPLAGPLGRTVQN